MDFTTSSEIYPLGCLSCHSSLVKSRYSSRISVFQLFYIHPKRRRFNHELSPFNWVSEFWVKMWWFELLGIAANAGFLSGFSGIESVPGPELPQVDFLNKFNGLVWSSSLFIVSWIIQLILRNSKWLPIFTLVLQKKTRRSMLNLTKDSSHLPCSKSSLNDPSWIKKSNLLVHFFLVSDDTTCVNEFQTLNKGWFYICIDIIFNR